MRTAAALLTVMCVIAVPAVLAADPQVPSASARIAPTDGAVTATTGKYIYDPSGNVAAIGASSYIYDPMGRVTTASVDRFGNVATQTYTYDVYGNRLTDGTLSYATGSNNRLTSFGAQYDVAGDLTQWQPPNSTKVRSYSYDALNAVMREKVTVSGSDQYVVHIYTADDERYWSLEGGAPDKAQSRYSLRDRSGQVLSEFVEKTVGSTQTWSVRDNVYREGLLLASHDTATGATHHYSLDHIGTPRVVTDQNHVIVAEHTYFPFGAEYTDGSVMDGRLRFTGHEERDGDLLTENQAELDYMHARYYSGTLGRFLAVDPMLDVKRAVQNPQMWNRYVYAADNPMGYTDPTGTTVYLVIYTTGNRHGDDEFRRAAETRAAEITQQDGYDSKKDTVLLADVRTKEDFAAAVTQANGMENQFGKVGEISLFSHSGPRDGPIFHDAAGHMTQLTRTEVGSLSVNWANNASARFYGCNTALTFAGLFTRQQGVATDGFSWYSSFSSNPDHYERIQPTGPVYMMSVAPRQLRSLGVTTPLPMTHYTPWPWDRQ